MLQRALTVAVATVVAVVATAFAATAWFGSRAERARAPQESAAAPDAVLRRSAAARSPSSAQVIARESEHRPFPPVLDFAAASSIELAALAGSQDDPRVRAEALHWLGESDGETAIQALRQGLSDPDLDVRRGAVRSLARRGGSEAEHAVSLMLQSPEPALRLEALDALALMNPGRTRPHLEMALTDGSEVVREAAAEWLAEKSRAN